ncbi:hypothetical protein Ancab_034261, partial [Ancistrocladus abbreviatus]
KIPKLAKIIFVQEILVIHLVAMRQSQISILGHFRTPMNISIMLQQKPKKLVHTISRPVAKRSSLSDSPNAVVGKIAYAVDYKVGYRPSVEEINALPPLGLRRELMPQQVAFVTDGNRRWAERRGLRPQDRYALGYRATADAMKPCCQ